MRFLPALAFLCLLVTLPCSALAEDPTRPYSPVQAGPVASAPELPRHVPGRVLVQFTESAHQKAVLPEIGTKTRGLPVTGLASLDRTLAELAVKGTRPAFRSLQNRKLASELGAERWYILDLDRSADIAAAVQRLQSDSNLSRALPDLVAFPAAVPDDTGYADNWGHNNTAQMPAFDWGGTWTHSGPGVGTVGFDSNAELAWDGTQGFGDPSVVIAILDTGVDVGHPDLLQTTGYDFGDDDGNPDDDSADPGHGTACAGVAAAVADNALGVTGVAGACTIMPCKISDSDGTLAFSYITDAIYWAADNGADIISMSFGADIDSYYFTDNALQYAHNAGVTLLAATGNSNSSSIEYPANNSHVIGVGAASPCGGRKRSGSDSGDVNPGVDTDPNGASCDEERWWGSSYGRNIQDHAAAVDVIAPTILPTTDIQGSGGYDSGNYSEFFNGTSCATPYAAGVAALIKSRYPSYTPNQVRDRLVDTAQDVENVESAAGWDRYSGYGMVDAAAAVGYEAPAAPVADFSADQTSGCAELNVQFSDASTGTITGWLWDFGTGDQSTSQNPGYQYTAAGTYTVSLTVTGPGGQDTLTLTDEIVVSDVPEAGFTRSASTVAFGAAVDFTDTSTGDPYQWFWDFGDGETSNARNPSHVFTAPGAYQVMLVATNACGADTLVDPGSLIVQAPPIPEADFTLDPSTGCLPVTVDFSDASSGSIDSWLWDFGDGGTSAEQNPTHEYTASGAFDVTLIVTNVGGADTLTVAGAVSVGLPPVAAFVLSDTLGVAPLNVVFSDESTGSIDTWFWDFGDGATATVSDPQHEYTAPGIYTVSLIVANECGADTLTVADALQVTAPAVAPVAGFTLDPAAGCAPVPVAFTDTSTGDIDTWDWRFGDGTASAEPNPAHTYNTPGIYHVRLIVAGAAGVDTLVVAEAVTVSQPVAAAFAVSDTLITYPNAITFTDESTGEVSSWNWDFGDGATDTVPDPTHTYTSGGLYDVTLIVSNGCSVDTLTVAGAVHVNGASGVGDLQDARFALQGNYPNPFNPSTTVVFTLEKKGHASLEVFDISGRRVATLVDEQRAAGRHEVVWRPRNVASGVYFTRLSADGQSATRRMTLLK